jgi:hypothetical protein
MDISLSDPPQDAIERLVWLSGAREAFDNQIEPMWRKAYFEARQTGRLEAALHLGYHSRKRIMAYTRAENERTGRQWKWGDGRG